MGGQYARDILEYFDMLFFMGAQIREAKYNKDKYHHTRQSILNISNRYNIHTILTIYINFSLLFINQNIIKHTPQFEGIKITIFQKKREIMSLRIDSIPPLISIYLTQKSLVTYLFIYMYVCVYNEYIYIQTYIYISGKSIY